LAAAAIAVVAWALGGSDGGPAVLGRSRAERPLPDVPRIDLARAEAVGPGRAAGRRDLFAFGAAVAREEEEQEVPAPPPPTAVFPGGAVGPGDAVARGPVTPSLPPLELKYIGSVESKAGVKVAVLITDRREVLTGQAGQVVANRYRIARIGLESVDLEDVGSGQSRRIPLKGS
jgi:hypothetical protein